MSKSKNSLKLKVEVVQEYGTGKGSYKSLAPEQNPEFERDLYSARHEPEPGEPGFEHEYYIGAVTGETAPSHPAPKP